MAIQSIFVICDNAQALKELCTGAKTMADTVHAVLFADQAAAQDAAACGADTLYVCPISEHTPDDYTAPIAQLIQKNPTALVWVNNSIRGRCFAGKLGALLSTAVLTNVADLCAQGESLTYQRMVYGGTAQRTEAFTTPYGVITLGSGAFEAAPEAATAPIQLLEPQPECGLKRVAVQEKREGGTNLAAAKRIVDIGRGLAKEEDLEICRKLASLLDAEVGCSRPVAENNKWLPKSVYMGVTGVQVKPDLCFVLGVSGQVQHIAGINKSKIIVAINKDKEAPIFKNADFGLVGDMYKILPALLEKLS